MLNLHLDKISWARTFLAVSMYSHHFQQRMDQWGMVANPASRGQ